MAVAGEVLVVAHVSPFVMTLSVQCVCVWIFECHLLA